MNPGATGWSGGAEWLRGEGESSDVVMSSRARIARNLAGYPFMTKASSEDRVQVLDLCRRRILCDEFKRAAGIESVMWVDLHDVDKLERQVLVERHLISRQHARGKLSTGKGGADQARGVAIGLPHERVAVMVNEEDQLRIQVIRSGLALSELLDQIDRIDDALEQGLDFAFHPRFGYLTACPTNIGTGIRFSVMLHLPGLKLTGEIERVKRAFNPRLDIQGVVLTMYDRRNNLSDMVAADVRAHLGDKVYETVIPRNVRVSEAPSFGKPVILYDMDCRGSQAYIHLASEVLKRERRISA